jgi:hypothetical protein
MAHLVSIRSTGSAGSSLTIHRVSGKPYEGKPHVRFDEGSIGYQGDDLLERDTHLKREKQFALTESAHHCTIVLLYSKREPLHPSDEGPVSGDSRQSVLLASEVEKYRLRQSELQ